MTHSPDNSTQDHLQIGGATTPDPAPPGQPLQPPADPLPNPEPAAPSLDQPDPGVFHHDPVKPPRP
jgi:hypothetical protein